jgi:hypothetical protein
MQQDIAATSCDRRWGKRVDVFRYMGRRGIRISPQTINIDTQLLY